MTLLGKFQNCHSALRFGVRPRPVGNPLLASSASPAGGHKENRTNCPAIPSAQCVCAAWDGRQDWWRQELTPEGFGHLPRTLAGNPAPSVHKKSGQRMSLPAGFGLLTLTGPRCQPCRMVRRCGREIVATTQPLDRLNQSLARCLAPVCVSLETRQRRRCVQGFPAQHCRRRYTHFPDKSP